jgi:hypothetical protein
VAARFDSFYPARERERVSVKGEVMHVPVRRSSIPTGGRVEVVSVLNMAPRVVDVPVRSPTPAPVVKGDGLDDLLSEI